LFSLTHFRRYTNNTKQKQQTQADKAATNSKSKATRKKKKKTQKKKKKVGIILTETIPKIGEKGEHLQVARGFARNYLLAKRLAVYDTPENSKLYEEWTKVNEIFLRNSTFSTPHFYTLVSYHITELTIVIHTHTHTRNRFFFIIVQKIDYEKKEREKMWEKAKKKLSQLIVEVK
jgi:ribosomal protein L9